jgi:hypothetical protein
MTSFEETLWEQLVHEHHADHAQFLAGQEHAERAGHAGRERIRSGVAAVGRRRPLLAGVSLTAVAAIVAGVVLILSATTGTAPAYALSANPDGSYTVRVFDLTTGIPELNAKFASLGIDETVIPVTPDCTYKGLFGDPAAAGSETFTISPGRSHLAPGYDGYLAATANADGSIALAIGAMKLPLPSCFSTDSPRFNPNPISTSGGVPTYTATSPSTTTP